MQTSLLFARNQGAWLPTAANLSAALYPHAAHSSSHLAYSKLLYTGDDLPTDVTYAFNVTPRPHCAQHQHSRLLLIRLAGLLRQTEDSLQTVNRNFPTSPDGRQAMPTALAHAACSRNRPYIMDWSET